MFSCHSDRNHMVIMRAICACLLTSIGFSHVYFFLQTIWICPVQTVHQVQSFHVDAWPDNAVQMYFGRILPKPVLGMTEFLQIVKTIIRQVICADLSASSRF